MPNVFSSHPLGVEFLKLVRDSAVSEEEKRSKAEQIQADIVSQRYVPKAEEATQLMLALIRLTPDLKPYDHKGGLAHSLIEYGADPNVVVYETYDDKLLLHLIVYEQEPLAQALVERNKDLDDKAFLVNRDKMLDCHNTPLIMALKRGCYDLALAIMDAIPQEHIAEHLNTAPRDDLGFTPLHLAASLYGSQDPQKEAQIIKRMLALGADPSKPNCYGYNAYDHLRADVTKKAGEPFFCNPSDLFSRRLTLFLAEKYTGFFDEESVFLQFPKEGWGAWVGASWDQSIMQDPALQCVNQYFIEDIIPSFDQPLTAENLSNAAVEFTKELPSLLEKKRNQLPADDHLLLQKMVEMLAEPLKRIGPDMQRIKDSSEPLILGYFIKDGQKISIDDPVLQELL